MDTESAGITAELEQIREPLKTLAKNSIRIIPHSLPDDQIVLGQSKLGGLPDLPASLRWPLWQPQQGDWHDWQDAPLCFVAQLRLSDLPSIDNIILPKEGMLYFFVAAWVDAIDSSGDSRECQVLFYKGDCSQLKRTDLPPVTFDFPDSDADYVPSGHAYQSAALDFRVETTLPHRFSLEVEQLSLSKEEEAQYRDLYWKMYPETEVYHRISGDAQPVQFEMRPSHEWLLLLQLESDLSLNMEWQGWGTLYFLIPANDLKRHDFRRVYCVMQCS